VRVSHYFTDRWNNWGKACTSQFECKIRPWIIYRVDSFNDRI